MKVIVKRWNAIAQWRWDTRSTNNNNNNNTSSSEPQQPQETTTTTTTTTNDNNDNDDSEDDLCGICRVAFEACCPSCKTPGDDCPLIWGKCSHVFHMHCLLKWIGTTASKGQCPMDRREWENAER